MFSLGLVFLFEVERGWVEQLGSHSNNSMNMNGHDRGKGD